MENRLAGKFERVAWQCLPLGNAEVSAKEPAQRASSSNETFYVRPIVLKTSYEMSLNGRHATG